MQNFTSIELNAHEMLVASAKSAGRRFQINQLFSIEIAEGETNKQLGEKLKTALAEKGIARTELIAVVHRQQVEMREVTVPPAPESELPDLVRFQARNVFANMNDQWALDFVPFGELSEEKPNRVLAIAISPKVKSRYVEIAEAAGIKLKRIAFRPYAFCDLFESRLSDAKNRLLIDPNQGQFDLSVVVGCQLIATRSLTAAAERDAAAVAQQVVGEVRRTMASTRSSLERQAIDQIIVGGNANDFVELGDLLNEKIDVPVVFADPFRSVDPSSLTAARPVQSERFTAVIGSLIREYSAGKHPVDFANPRRPLVKKRDFRKLAIAAGLAAVLLLGCVGSGWFMLSSQSNRISKLQKELTNLEAENQGKSPIAGVPDGPSLDSIIGEVQVLDDWQNTDVAWLDQLATISKLLLSPDDIIVSSFRGVPLQKGEGFQIYLTTQMTEKTSRETEWKQKLFEHFDNVVFGDTTADSDDPDYPVTHNITLVANSDLAKTVERYTALAEQAVVDSQAIVPAEESGNAEPPSG